ncbi:MAG: fused MFS/spermidine synthase, partial [Deltaproteobacteria bacterium]|nr:fused MFS/spermidine synthase [Deltaproteobacteria bacterium]
HSPIGAGRANDANDALGSPQTLRAWRNTRRANVVWERDGIESSIALVVDGAYAFLVNGKSDGNSVSDGSTQVMLGLLGPLFHPHPTRALVVGLGTGSTAGWLAGVPSVEKVDVVEIEPAVIDVAEACSPVNRNVLRDPKVAVHIGDAREILQTSSETYDLIISEPSNPYRAGVANLFSREFYATVRARLGAGGLLVQWLQTYEVDARTIAGVYATLHAELPYIHTWTTGGGDVVLLASATPIPLSLPELRARIATPAFAGALRRQWHADDLEGVFAHFVGDERLAAGLAARAPINTDDRPLVEYGFARTAGAKNMFTTAELFEATKQTLAIPAQLRELDWGALLAIRRRDDIEPTQLPDGVAADRIALVAVADAWNKGDVKAAAQRFAAQPFEPRDRYEQLIAASLSAVAGDLEGLGRVEALQAALPTEAAILRAVLAVALGDPANAAASVAAAARLLRDDPWVPAQVLDQLLAAATAIAKADPASGRRVFDALAEPWAARVHDAQRLAARLKLSEAVDVAGTCVAALDAVEPYPPWVEQVLEYRVRCYTETRHARLRTAERELAEWRALAPPRLRDLLKN